MGLLNKILGISEIREPRFVKEFNNDDNENLLKLNNLLSLITDECRETVEKEIVNLKSGLAGERNVYYELKNSRLPILCLHDIRLEYKEHEAQFDFIVIATNFILVIETKRMFGNIHIDNEGNFTREFLVGKKLQKQGMYSPITQNERHIALLKELLIDHKLIKYCPVYSLVVIANDKTIVDKKFAKAEVKNTIIKYDQLIERLKQFYQTVNQIKIPDSKLFEIANFIQASNKPLLIDYVKKLNLTLASQTEEKPTEMIEKEEDVTNNSKLYLELKEYRLHKSKSLNIKPYYVFNNNELDMLVKERPVTKEAFIGLPGFAEKKYEQFGVDIIAIIKNKSEELSNALVQYRLEKSRKLNVKAYEIFNNLQLDEIIKLLPFTTQEMEKITSYKKHQIEQFGSEIINVLKNIM